MRQNEDDHWTLASVRSLLEIVKWTTMMSENFMIDIVIHINIYIEYI